jgi:phage tail sheath gpL-like
MKNLGLTAAVAQAAGLDEKTAETVTVDAAFMKQYFPEVAASLVSEGKAAETARIAGIEQAFMPGHEAIIKAHKADPAKTPADAMAAVIAAENGLRSAAAAALVTDETQVRGLRSETANPALPEKKAEAVPEGEEKWKAEWATGAPRAEHGYVNEEHFLADKRAEARGAVKELKNRRDA